MCAYLLGFCGPAYPPGNWGVIPEAVELRRNSEWCYKEASDTATVLGCERSGRERASASPEATSQAPIYQPTLRYSAPRHKRQVSVPQGAAATEAGVQFAGCGSVSETWVRVREERRSREPEPTAKCYLC
ncbi:unnamed protein product, partial [Iphiclides podalirius]